MFTGMTRRVTKVATAGVAAHVFFEFAAGVGMPVRVVPGPGTSRDAVGRLHRRGLADRRQQAGVGGPGVHRDQRRPPGGRSGPLPGLAAMANRVRLAWLVDCEDLGPDLMRFYNPILHLSGAAAVGAISTENRSAPKALAPLVVLITVPVLILGQRGEFRRHVHRAQWVPRWWNRRPYGRTHDLPR